MVFGYYLMISHLQRYAQQWQCSADAKTSVQVRRMQFSRLFLTEIRLSNSKVASALYSASILNAAVSFCLILRRHAAAIALTRHGFMVHRFVCACFGRV